MEGCCQECNGRSGSVQGEIRRLAERSARVLMTVLLQLVNQAGDTSLEISLPFLGSEA